MKRILQVFYVLFSAIIFTAAIQNEILVWGSPFLGLFALVPVYIALKQSTSYLEASLLTGLQIFTVHLLSSFWLGNFRDFAVFTLGASAAGTGVIGMVFGCYLYYAVKEEPDRSGFLIKQQKNGATLRSIFLFAAVWTLYEWAKSTGFLAYPWGTLVMTAYRWPVMTQIADITGTWGISFLFSLFAACIGEGILLLREIPAAYPEQKTFRFKEYVCSSACCIALFSAAALYGIYQLTQIREPVKYMDTVLVQQNIDSWNGGSDSEAVSVSAALTTEAVADCRTATGAQPDLIVWSESVISYAFPQAESYYRKNPYPVPLIPFIAATNVPFIIGAPVTINREKQQYGNAAVLFDKDGKYHSYYAKMQLVPFAEVIPGAEYEWVQKFLDKIIGFSSGWTPGTELTLFSIPLKTGDTVSVSTPICFEDAFPSVCRALYHAGSEVFVNLTNDSWSMTRSAEYQHFVISSYRAIEYRTTLVRSTNSGYTVVVDPTGQVIYDLPLFEPASLYVPVPVFQRTNTVYALLGDWLPLICGLGYLIDIIRYKFRK